MTEYWLDYSAAKLSGKTIRDYGYTGVIRYIDAPDRLRTKHTNRDEYNDHIANGLHVLLVMQNTTTDADGGWNAGVANALRAKAGADYLGYVDIIFFTNDRTTVPNPKAWQDYLDGAASVLGRDRVGAYGFGNAIDAAQGHAVAFWQSGRRSELRDASHFWQDNNTQVTVGGVLCDRNLVVDIPTAGPSPITPGKNEDEPMIVKAAVDDYVSIPCDGKTLLFISAAFGRTVKVLNIAAVRDNQGSAAAYTEVGMLPRGKDGRLGKVETINPDQPGPITVGGGCRAIQLRYSADHDFTVWCA